MTAAINAAGHLSSLGGSVLSPAVRAAMDAAGTEYREMRLVLHEAEAELAALCGAEGACVTAGAAAGIAIAVAACVTRGDPDPVGRLPALDVPRREVVVQAGHLINFGATVEQMVLLGGGLPRVAGARDRISRADVEAAFGPDTACFLWVQSHHTRENASLPLDECLDITKAAGVPFVMDCAAEEDLRAFTRMGADLTIYSGTKAIKAPVSGIIAGGEPLVSWCRAQSRGIARAMKVGKEQVGGLLAAIREYAGLDAGAERDRQEAILQRLEVAFAGLAGVAILRIDDEAGRAIQRLAIRLEPRRASALAAALQGQDPPVFTRPHRLREGLVQFDPRCLSDEDVDSIVDAVRRVWPPA